MAGRNLRNVFVVSALALTGMALPYSVAGAAAPPVQLVNELTGQCLDADTGTLHHNGTVVHLWGCHDDTNQRWVYDSGTRTLRNHASGRCLDADQSSEGRTVHLWDCHGGDNQQWLGDAEGLTLRNVAYGRCLDLDTGNGNGTTVQLWPCHGESNQGWSFRP